MHVAGEAHQAISSRWSGGEKRRGVTADLGSVCGPNIGGMKVPSAKRGRHGDAGLSDSRAKPGLPPSALPEGFLRAPHFPWRVPLHQRSNLMVVPLLGDEEIQREEAQEDSDGGEGRGS